MFRQKVKSVDYESIHERYQDTSLVIYKKRQQASKEKTRRRPSRKLSILRSSSKVTKMVANTSEETPNDSAMNCKDVPVVSSGLGENNLTDDAKHGVISTKEPEQEQTSRRLGVESKICSVL